MDCGQAQSEFKADVTAMWADYQGIATQSSRKNANVSSVCLECESIELDTKTPSVTLADVKGTVEINCNLDMEVVCHSLNGEVSINQVSATSKIRVPEGVTFTVIAKGVGTSISYEKDGKQTEDFSVAGAENVIELNGIKSELVICTCK